MPTATFMGILAYRLINTLFIMAQKFKLIERKNLGKDNTENPRKFYAQAVNNGYVSFDELCGEIGNFRLAVGSTGSLTAKAFSTAQIKTPKIVFTPGGKLRTTRALTTFERQAEGEEPAAGGDSESPDEI